MTITTSKNQPAGSNPGNPALTEAEARRLGYSKDEFRQAANWRRMTVEHHMTGGTARHAWYPPQQVGRGIAEPFIDDAAADLTARLESEVDPELELSQDSIEETKSALDELEGRTDPLLTLEAGVAYSPADAVLHVHELDEKIETDEHDSKGHHRRAPYWLKKIAPWLPWADSDRAGSSHRRNTVVGSRSLTIRSAGLSQLRIRRGRSLRNSCTRAI